jgi:hypothetical protein
MTIEELQKLIQGIFDNVFNAVTQAEPGGKPVAQASTTMLSLMKPGLAINSSDFRNPWTPGNVNGSQDAAINTARLVDVAPKMSAERGPNQEPDTSRLAPRSGASSAISLDSSLFA